MARIITLLTDWGNGDPFLATMKGVIAGIAPDARVIDISHAVKKFDVREGAHFLSVAFKYFPKGTIHVGVVDPGVGSKRKPIIIRTKNYFFVGPDNGLLSAAAREDGIVETVEITNRKMMLENVSRTTHGRDMFAPAAAHLAKGVPLSKFGKKLAHCALLELPRAAVLRGHIYGEVIYADSFGNLRTNISAEDLRKAGFFPGKELTACIAKKKQFCFRAPLCENYACVGKGDVLLVVAGDGLLEISLREGSAAEKFKVAIGDRVELKG